MEYVGERRERVCGGITRGMEVGDGGVSFG